MNTVRAIYENGVFRPTHPVDLPEASEVVFEPRPAEGPIEPIFISRPNPSPEEFRRLLDELSANPTGKVLPPDFSRADIYDDHD